MPCIFVTSERQSMLIMEVLAVQSRIVHRKGKEQKLKAMSSEYARLNDD